MTTTGWIRKRPWWPGCALCWRWAGTRRLCTRHARLATLLDPLIDKLAADGAAIASDIMLYGEAWYHPASRTVVDPRSVADSRHYDLELIGDRWQGPELKRFWFAPPAHIVSPLGTARVVQPIRRHGESPKAQPLNFDAHVVTPIGKVTREVLSDMTVPDDVLDRAFPHTRPCPTCGTTDVGGCPEYHRK